MECKLLVSWSSLKSFPRLGSDHIINWVNSFNYKRKSIQLVFTKLKVWSLDIELFSGYTSSHFTCFTCYLQHSNLKPQNTKQAKVNHNWMQHHSYFTGKMLMHRKVVNTLVKIKTVSSLVKIKTVSSSRQKVVSSSWLIWSSDWVILPTCAFEGVLDAWHIEHIDYYEFFHLHVFKLFNPCRPTVLKWDCIATFWKSFNGTATENT